MLYVFRELGEDGALSDAAFSIHLAPTAGGGYRNEKPAGMCQNDSLI
jgi:hypothetical protein